MNTSCNIWMICLESNWLFYDPSWMLQLSEFIWTLRSSSWVVFNNFLLIDATDRSKINGDQKRLFFANSPFGRQKNPFLNRFKCSRLIFIVSIYLYTVLFYSLFCNDSFLIKYLSLPHFGRGEAYVLFF